MPEIKKLPTCSRQIRTYALYWGWGRFWFNLIHLGSIWLNLVHFEPFQKKFILYFCNEKMKKLWKQENTVDFYRKFWKGSACFLREICYRERSAGLVIQEDFYGDSTLQFKRNRATKLYGKREALARAAFLCLRRRVAAQGAPRILHRTVRKGILPTP